ncbi:hypothetical protein IPA_08725 [Ignicoccus pacificus DSM 13166]|uniref:Phosphoesterase n=1 Tax=Ignicoccus pacificus DSM 13166 TaxID=940294 RepID=A0A977PLC0_9CREN|nr:hypothetical protein IPA_08725 [Ignicoccus pacificus DSM 13166]
MKDLKGNYAVVVHRHADPDAVGAASPFKLLGSPTFYAPGGLSSLGKKVAKHAGIEFVEEAPKEDVIIILDTASTSQLPGVNLEGKRYYRIDHHATGNIEPFAVDPSATSTSEIVALALRLLEMELPVEISESLMSGIIYDSKGFRLAKPNAFKAMEYLSRYGSVQRAFSLLEAEEIDFSKRMARVKACERLVYRKVKEYLIGATRIGANEGDVARTMISIGLDVIYVIREEKDEIRVYARCSPRILKLGFDVSKLLKSIGEELGGSGGGHPGAGGMVIPPIEVEKLINKLLGRTSREIARLLSSGGKG